MSRLTIEVLTSLAANREVAQIAARVSAELMAEHNARFSMDRWDKPTIAAFQDGKVIGFAQVEPQAEYSSANVDLAWCSSAHPKALAMLAVAIRKWAADKKVDEILFSVHRGNKAMHRLANILRAEPVLVSYRLNLPKRPNREEPTK